MQNHRRALVTSLEHAFFTAGYPLICVRFLQFPLVSCHLIFFGLGLGGFYRVPLVLVWAGWILWFSTVFLWFPSVSFDFLWFPLIFFGLELGGFYGFPLVSFVPKSISDAWVLVYSLLCRGGERYGSDIDGRTGIRGK